MSAGAEGAVEDAEDGLPRGEDSWTGGSCGAVVWDFSADVVAAGGGTFVAAGIDEVCGVVDSCLSLLPRLKRPFMAFFIELIVRQLRVSLPYVSLSCPLVLDVHGTNGCQ